MKTTTLKVTISFVAIICSINGAFTANEAKQKNLTPTIGYITTLDYGLCAMNTVCGYGDSFCTVMYNGQTYQAFGKLINGLPICPIILQSREN